MAICGSPNCQPSLSRPRRTASSARCARPAWPARLNAPNHAESGAARSSTREPSSRARGRAGGRLGPAPMPAKATAAAKRPRGEIMHSFILQQLVAGHVKDQLAAADDARRAREARRARRSRAARQTTRSSLPGSQAGLERGSATIAAAPAANSTAHRVKDQVEARIQTPGHVSASADATRSSSPPRASPSPSPSSSASGGRPWMPVVTGELSRRRVSRSLPDSMSRSLTRPAIWPADPPGRRERKT